MRQRLLAALIAIVLSSPALATPPGQYRVVLKPDMVTSSFPAMDFSTLVDEQLELGDPPTGSPETPWPAEWKYAKEFPISATVDLGKKLPLATLWIYDTNGSGDVKIEAGEPDAWEDVTTYDCAAYKQWKAISLDREARYLRLTIMTPAPAFTEIAVDAHSPKGYETLLAKRAEEHRLEQKRLAALKLAREEALKRPLIEMEPYGTLSLVDQIDCTAKTPTHGFSDNPAGCSHVETVLGRPCRVMPTVKDECSTITYTIGKMKLLRPGGVYVLTVEYPEDAPRSMIVVNNGNEVARGFYTGQTLGDALHSKYVGSLPESLDVPLSEEYQTWSLIVRLHDRFGTNGLIRGNARPRTQTPEDGFEVSIGQWTAKDAPMSKGAAISRICLYEVVDADQLGMPLADLPEGLPKRRIFWREEMADGVIGGKKPEDRGLDNYLDWYRHKAELMRFLGMNTYTKDLLEFGANQAWDSSPYGGNDWVYYNGDMAHYWENIVTLMGEYGFDILPYYEYSGSKGKNGLGNQRRCKPLTRDDAYSHISWIESHNADITDPDTYEDFRKMLDLTIVRMRDKAHFAGAWLRSRSQMPVGFGPGTLKRFSDEANEGKLITREDLKGDEAIYARYLQWWHLKRRDFFIAMRDYLRSNGIDDAMFLYTGESGEPGVGFGDWTPRFVAQSPDAWASILARPEHLSKDTMRTLLTPGQVVDQELYLTGLLSPGLDWGGWESRHRAPADDPQNYKDMDGIVLTHAFNRSYTVASPKTLDTFRAPSGLAIMRHYPLNEHMMFDKNDKTKLGYFVTDMERAGPYCMMAEAVAVANGDPNMIGYLTSNSLGVGFPKYVRNFNANFLALPALPSKLVPNASSNPAIIVRAIETPNHGTWYALVNTGMTTAKNIQLRIPGGKPIESALTGERLSANGAVQATFCPFELKAWRVK
jgi:hypothetical protein